MATKLENLSNPASCLNKASLHEPIFVLRAHDKLAADAVRRWAYARGLAHGYDEVYADAVRVADEMDDWRAKHRG